MTADPFATAPEEPETPPAQEPKNNTVFATKEDAISDPAHYPIKVTLKGGSGYDAPWLTFDFRSVDDADETLNGPDGARLAGVLAKVQDVAKFFVSKNVLPAPVRGGGGSAAPAAKVPDFMGTAPSCEHGTKTYITKVSAKTGKPWHAWGCPGTKDNQCQDGLEFKYAK